MPVMFSDTQIINQPFDVNQQQIDLAFHEKSEIPLLRSLMLYPFQVCNLLPADYYIPRVSLSFYIDNSSLLGLWRQLHVETSSSTQILQRFQLQLNHS